MSKEMSMYEWAGLNPTLEAPVTYQGGKTRIATDIVKIIEEKVGPLGDIEQWFELCCGTAAVTLEAINRGLSSDTVTLVDRGPWGMFWESVGNGEFDQGVFEDICSECPEDPKEVKGWLEGISEGPVGGNAPYHFLLLQAGAFGGKAVRINEGKWKTPGMRGYWEPTEDSKSDYPVRTMMPKCSTIQDRMSSILSVTKGRITGQQGDIRDINPISGGVIYIDPPYKGSTGYGGDLVDIEDFVQTPRFEGTKVFVSEARPLGGASESRKVTGSRKQGGISGSRDKKGDEEWVSIYK